MKQSTNNGTDYNIILFLCNWGPHTAYQTLQDRAAEIPSAIKMVRIPCSGRISKALLFKPFEMGADGVALLGCEEGSCRYGSGTITAQRNVEDTRSVLDLLGLGSGRLRLENFMPDESEALLKFLKQFIGDIESMGKSPVIPGSEDQRLLNDDDRIKEIVARHDVYACQDCGKCSSACSLTLVGKPFSPRSLASAVIAGDVADPSLQKDIWSCLTCGICYDRCPSAVNFPEFIRDMRHVIKKMGFPGLDVHGGFLQSLMRTMTSPDIKIDHWKWLPPDIQVDPKSKTLFFGGCAPYFDLFFKKHLGIRTSNILTDGLRLLNFFDIHPALLPDERCCGHDLLWSGDKDNYRRLAKLNIAAIHRAGVDELITACPECYHTFARDYPQQGIDVDFKVTHIFDLLEKEIDKGAVGFKALNRRTTFQDPCRLSRFQDRADLPRKLINRLNSQGLREMQDRETNALCCGNSAWTGCDTFSKALQVKRLRQARDTGADLLITACPKCQIHLHCAMEDPFSGKELEIELMDLTSLLANTIEWQ